MKLNLKFLYFSPIRDKFDCDLENKFKNLRESDRLQKLSKHIRTLLNSSNDTKEDTNLLLESWKDFLVSIAKVSINFEII